MYLNIPSIYLSILIAVYLKYLSNIIYGQLKKNPILRYINSFIKHSREINNDYLEKELVKYNLL